jgi:hypothetical protein
MAQHIYMSVTAYGELLNVSVLSTGEKLDSGLFFNYRGEAGATDDAQSFKRLMEKRGYAVLIRDDTKPGIGRNLPASYFPELGG